MFRQNKTRLLVMTTLLKPAIEIYPGKDGKNDDDEPNDPHGGRGQIKANIARLERALLTPFWCTVENPCGKAGCIYCAPS
jgi:hypothetical protein